MVHVFVLVVALLAQPSGEKAPARDRTPAKKGTPASSPETGSNPEAPRHEAPGGAENAKCPVAFPHPLITEILYAVPKGEDADANQDGKRSATGDEFIEIVNPHDKAISVKGYVLSDGVPAKGPDSRSSRAKSDAKGKGAPKRGGDGSSDEAGGDKEKGEKPARKAPKGSRLAFEFPDLTLQPGEVAVVFNGFEASIPGAVGDSGGASGKNDKLGGAYVFTMRVKSQFAALANTGDCVLLTAPDGHAVQCVVWGSSDKTPEVPGAVRETAPESSGSVQRRGFGGFVPHRELAKDAVFSPGEFEVPGKAKAIIDKEEEGAGKKRK